MCSLLKITPCLFDPWLTLNSLNSFCFGKFWIFHMANLKILNFLPSSLFVCKPLRFLKYLQSFSDDFVHSSSFPRSWLELDVAAAPLFSSSSSKHSLSIFKFFISDMSRKAENDDCFNWMFVFVHGWYMVWNSDEETTGFFGTSWRTSQPDFCGMVAKNLIRSSSSGLEFSSDSIDWRLKISQYLEFAIFSWCGNSAFTLKGHSFSISLFKSSKESKLSPSFVRSQFDMPESVGILSDDDTKKK